MSEDNRRASEPFDVLVEITVLLVETPALTTAAKDVFVAFA